MTSEQEIFLAVLNRGIHLTEKEAIKTTGDYASITEQQWKKLAQTASWHGVDSFFYEAILEEKHEAVKSIKDRLQKRTRNRIYTNYRLWAETKKIQGLLQKEKIASLVLKGPATAAKYPVPELRKSGDIDILIDPRADFRKAKEIIRKNGYQAAADHFSLHHDEFSSPEGIVVELHRMMTEPFYEKKVNAEIKKITEEAFQNPAEVMVMDGISFTTLTDEIHALYLLVHMLHHFLQKGFGWKLLCDWSLFWSHTYDKEMKEKFISYVEKLGLMTFTRTITEITVRYLGLDEKNVAFISKSKDTETIDKMVMEIFDAQEFGENGSGRMVMTRGNSLFSLVREFHYQMRRNYRNASRVVLIWPILWAATLVVFVKNNKTLRDTSSRKIIESARTRSDLADSLALFKK